MSYRPVTVSSFKRRTRLEAAFRIPSLRQGVVPFSSSSSSSSVGGKWEEGVADHPNRLLYGAVASLVVWFWGHHLTNSVTRNPETLQFVINGVLGASLFGS